LAFEQLEHPRNGAKLKRIFGPNVLFRPIADISIHDSLSLIVNEPEQNSADYRTLPNAAYLLILAVAAPIFFLFASRDEAVRGFVAALSICAVLGVAVILRPHSGQRAYWATLVAMAATHVLLVALIPWPREFHGPGIVLTPLVVVDMYVWARLILAMAKVRNV
jgi:hypothetical protein